MKDSNAMVPITNMEKKLVRTVLAVLRSGKEEADFLNWWLDSYGCKILSPTAPPSPTPESWCEDEFSIVEPALVN